MILPVEGYSLKIFIGEMDKHENIPLYEWIIRKAQEEGMAGATVIRAMEGYGVHSQLHTARILRLSTDLPIIVEIVEEKKKIEKFLTKIKDIIEEGLITLEKVEFKLCRKKSKKQ